MGPWVVQQGVLDHGQFAAGPVQLAQVRQAALAPLQLPGQPLHIRHACTM